MIKDNLIWVANNEKGENICILPKMANRHGLVAGATGTGKTVTLKVMAESFSKMGVPVFMADVKGDVASLMKAGTDSENMQERIQRFGLAEAGFSYQGFPVTVWDIFGKTGIPLRTTISEMGPLLLARVLGLNDLQSDILRVAFKIADDQKLLLVDTKDLKALMNYIDEHSDEFTADYGKISSASVGVIIRAIVALETVGGETFFGEPALAMNDWLTTNAEGKGMINILDSSSLINNGQLYSTFLLWFLSELFEVLPEVGDMDKPKLVFFFDEAHLLFNDSPKALVDKIEQMVKLIRSKGVGVYFCTQNPRDVPDGVLAQLSNKIQHGLRAYTPADQKAVKAAAESFRVNPDFDTYDTILELGTGEAVVSFMQADGTPGVAEKVAILPPESNFGTVTPEERDSCVKGSLLYSKYATPVDPDSAYEFLQRQGQNEAAVAAQNEAAAAQAKADEKAAAAAQKEAEKAQAAAIKAAEKEAAAQAKAAEKAQKEAEKAALAEQRRQDAAKKKLGNTVGGTVGREVGKSVGEAVLGKFGKTLGGNVGAQLGRGLMETFLKK